MDIEKRRLALFIPTLHGGGAERVMINLARGLTERGWDVDLVVAKAEGVFVDEVPKEVRLIDLKSQRVRTCLYQLYRYLRHEKPYVLLSAMGHANIAALLMRRLACCDTRIVVSIHASLSKTSSSNHPVKKHLEPWLCGFFYPWADAIVTVSEGAANDLSKIGGLPRESISVIYNPVVMPDLQEKGQASLEHPWFSPGSVPVILGVGRLTPQKNFASLIRAFHLLRQSIPARLIILGEGNEREKLESLVKEMGMDHDVQLPGFVSNPYSYMSRAAIFVLSSEWEALPTVLIEAMAMGTPVIATDCPSGPHEILKGGEFGSLIPVNDDQSLARAMAEVLTSHINTPSQRQELMERTNDFSLSRAVDNYIKVMVGTSLAGKHE